MRDYSSSPLFIWLRKRVFKIVKPYALPWGEWDKWRADTKKQHPIGWFMTETLPDLLEIPGRLTVDPFNDLRYYCRQRFFLRSHVIKTDLPRGRYQSTGDLMLYGCFSAFMTFVEVEKAWQHICSDADYKKYNVPWHQKFWATRWIIWRCPQAGLDHLRWESTLDHPDLLPEEQSPGQAVSAREQLVLYKWWREIRPNRPDPYDASGWSAIHDEIEAAGFKMFDEDLPSELRKRSKDAGDKSSQIEEDYKREDEEMLIRLVKLRDELWT